MTDNKGSASTLEANNAPLTANPDKKQGFWTRGKKIGCGVGVLTFIVLFLVIFLPILFLVIGPKVAQKNINSSVLTIQNAGITNPTNTTFDLALKIAVSNAGTTKAKLSYATPLTVAWLNPFTMTEVPILQMTPAPFSVSGGTGTIDTTIAGVTVLDQAALAMFNKFLIGGPSFQWRLTAGMTAHALGRDYHDLSMNKIVTVAGMGGLQNTTIREFELPGFPATANQTLVPITMRAVLKNPSPVGLELGAIQFNVFTDSGFPLGVATSKKTFLAAAGPTTLELEGSLFELAKLPIPGILGLVMDGKLNLPVQVIPLSVGGADPVSWISGALVGAKLNATLGHKD